MIKMSSGYLFDPEQLKGLITFLESSNWPYPTVFGYSSQIIELIAGILILFGIRLGAVALFLVLFCAVVFAHGFKIFADAQLPMNYAIMALIIILLGSGRFSLDSILQNRRKNR